MCKASEKFFEWCCKSQNHRLAEVESDLWRSYDSTTPSLRRDNPQFVTEDCVQIACVDSLTSLGIQFQHSVMLTVEKRSLNFRQNLLCQLLPEPVTGLHCKELVSTTLHPSFRYLYTLINNLFLDPSLHWTVLVFSAFPHEGQSVPLIILVTTRNSLQSAYVSFVLMNSELDTILQVWVHQFWIKRNDNLLFWHCLVSMRFCTTPH